MRVAKARVGWDRRRPAGSVRDRRRLDPGVDERHGSPGRAGATPTHRSSSDRGGRPRPAPDRDNGRARGDIDRHPGGQGRRAGMIGGLLLGAHDAEVVGTWGGRLRSSEPGSRESHSRAAASVSVYGAKTITWETRRHDDEAAGAAVSGAAVLAGRCRPSHRCTSNYV